MNNEEESMIFASTPPSEEPPRTAPAEVESAGVDEPKDLKSAEAVVTRKQEKEQRREERVKSEREAAAHAAGQSPAGSGNTKDEFPPVPPFEMDPKLFQSLIVYAQELESIFAQVQKMKAEAGSREDWETIMIFIAQQKPRVTHMSANAKAIFNKIYGDRIEEVMEAESIRNNGKVPSMDKLKTFVNRDVYEVQRVSKRLEQSWNDLQDLLWAVKTVVENISDETKVPKFDTVPDALFAKSVDDLV